MNIVWAALIVAAATAVAVAAMLAVRRRAPEGSYFADSDRAAGHLRCPRHRVLGPARLPDLPRLRELRRLAVRRGDRGADRRPADPDGPAPAGRRRRRPHRRAGLLRPVGHRRRVGPDGGRLARRGHQPVGRRDVPDAAGRRARARQPRRRRTGSGSTRRRTREMARQDRIHGAAGVMPTPLWIALFFISVIVLVYLFGFADSGERAWVQALFMGSVVAVIVTMLLLLQLPRRSVPRRRRRPPAGGDGTHRAAHRPAAGGHRRRRHDPLRRRGTRRDGADERPPTASRRGGTGSRSSPPCCSRWPRSPRRGAATRRTGGTASRPRRPSRVNALRIDAARAQGLAEGQTQVDIAMFFQWVNATATGDAELADFYHDRFRPEFRPAFDAWQATDPLDQPRRAADAVRDGRVPAAGADRRRTARRRGGGDGGRSSAATSSAPPTTCSASCCSPSPCSSPG